MVTTAAPPRPDERTLALLDAYLEELRAIRNLSAYTLRNYRADTAAFLGWLSAHDIAPLKATRGDLRRYLGELTDAGTARASQARKVSTIHTFYRHLVEKGQLASDPFYGVGLPKKTRRLPRIVERPDIETLLDAPPNDEPAGVRDRAILELLYAAGLRVSELTSLDLRDLDLEHRVIVVHGKGNQQRGVLIGRPARAALRRYIAEARPEALARSPRGAATGAVFLNRSGGRLTVRSVQMLVRKWATKAGIAVEVHPHLLRHSFATHMLDNGAELRVVQELLGHSSANTTQIYADVTAERQRASYEAAFYNQLRPRRSKED